MQINKKVSLGSPCHRRDTEKENIRAARGGQTGREMGPALSSAVDLAESGPEQGQAHRTRESWREPDAGSRLRRAAYPRGAHTGPCGARRLRAVQQVPRGGEGEVKAAGLRARPTFGPRPSRPLLFLRGDTEVMNMGGYRSDEHGGDTEVMNMEGGTAVMNMDGGHRSDEHGGRRRDEGGTPK